MYHQMGGVSLRYEFVDVVVNGVYKGVYALEEGFNKRLIENSNKREGPIIRVMKTFYGSNGLIMRPVLSHVFITLNLFQKRQHLTQAI